MITNIGRSERFVLFLLAASLLTREAAAQNVTFAGAQTTVPTKGLTCPRGVSVDGAGDVFIADSNDYRIVEVPAGWGTQFNVGSGWKGPNGVTVDGAGDLFVADSLRNSVVEVPAGGGPQFTVGSGLKDPGGVALDGAGDVFIADTENNRVVEVPAGGGPQFTVGSGLKGPRDVAADPEGDVFIADTSHNRVVEVLAKDGRQQTLPTSGLIKPSGVALDAAGDLFVSDLGNSRVVELPAGGGSQTTLLTSGLTNPYGVATDGSGDLFIVNFGSSTTKCPQPGESRATFSVVELQLVAVNFGTVTINSSSSRTLNYDVAAPTTFGPIKLVSNGEPSFDFNVGDGSTCTGMVAAGSSCTVNVNFTPIATGERTGEVELTDSSGNLLVATQVSGFAKGSTATVLSSVPNPSTKEEPVTFAAAITPAPPDGESVTFELVSGSDHKVLGVGSLAGGTASFVTSTLSVGTKSIIAVYGGDSDLAGSTSNTLQQVVNR